MTAKRILARLIANQLLKKESREICLVADVAVSAFPRLKAKTIEILQINVGLKCNLSCQHCHVNAGPDRTEVMSREVLQQCLDVIKKIASINTVDITGGSPEMNPHLAWFIKEVSKLGRRLLVRSNLVVLLEPEYSKFTDIYAANRVEVVASLPCYLEENVDSQRGKKSFAKSIKVLQLLNKRGYGHELILDLVYNPVGPELPGSQAELAEAYKAELKQKYGVIFNNLFCITNMPIGRFLENLKRAGKAKEYLQLLVNAFSPAAVANVMCRGTVSVAWDGQLYDCDFNQALDLPILELGHIDKFNYDKLSQREIVIKNHCYGCTAGAGSSCQGALG